MATTSSITFTSVGIPSKSSLSAHKISQFRQCSPISGGDKIQRSSLSIHTRSLSSGVKAAKMHQLKQRKSLKNN
ncbi:3-oxoacyl-[acyl-carrier-protein] reductase [Ranunculus cassubicifolius]